MGAAAVVRNRELQLVGSVDEKGVRRILPKEREFGPPWTKYCPEKLLSPRNVRNVQLRGYPFRKAALQTTV
jgi:hypothetical protein